MTFGFCKPKVEKMGKKDFKGLIKALGYTIDDFRCDNCAHMKVELYEFTT